MCVVTSAAGGFLVAVRQNYARHNTVGLMLFHLGAFESVTAVPCLERYSWVTRSCSVISLRCNLLLISAAVLHGYVTAF